MRSLNARKGTGTASTRKADRSLTTSIGVMAYNEELNIGRLLEELGKQELSCCEIQEIVVVASGCTDRTESIVREAAKVDRRIHLIHQAKREGKARAINLFLQRAVAAGVDVCILQSGDTLPQARTIDALLRPMAEDSVVGMTGAHVVPVNSEKSFVGGVVHTLWRLHHLLAMEEPKMGELVAFRNIVLQIPDDSAVDEVSVEAAITSQGHTLKYAPDAIVLNKGPETLSDFIKQRRRIHAGHLDVARRAGYRPSTMSLSRVGRHFFSDALSKPRRLPVSLGAAALETVGRALGAYDVYVAGRNHAVWDIAATTKDVKGH